MKTSTFILIFSGLTGLNRCSTDVKLDFPFFKSENKTEVKDNTFKNDSLDLVKINNSDSATSSLMPANTKTYYWYKTDEKLIYSGNII